MSLTKTTYSMLHGGLVNVMDFGAVGNNSNDDTQAIKDAIASITNGGCIYFPTGQYKITSKITVPGDISIHGESATGSAIQATSCDVFEFSPNSGIGPVTISDIAIFGNSCNDKVAISAPGTADAADKVTGLHIDNVRIQGFRDAINFRTVWTSSITNCVLYQNVFGVVVRGQCVKLDIRNNYIHHSTLGTAITTGTGVYVLSTSDYNPGGVTEKRPEDIQVHENLVFLFPYGARFLAGLFITACDNDFDANTSYGIQVGSVSGTMNLNNNWIGMVGSAGSAGIEMYALGTPAYAQKNIKGNEINSRDAACDNGIVLYSNQHNADISGNTISNTTIDVSLEGCGDIAVKDNLCKSSAATSLNITNTPVSRVITIADNRFDGAIYVHPATNASQIIFGQNSGATSTLIRGKSVIANGATTVTTTYASLPTIPSNFSAATTYIYPELFIQTPKLNVGSIWGTCTDTAVTITCQTTPATDMTIYWEVRGFPAGL